MSKDKIGQVTNMECCSLLLRVGLSKSVIVNVLQPLSFGSGAESSESAGQNIEQMNGSENRLA